jgi:hypothetical protein
MASADDFDINSIFEDDQYKEMEDKSGRIKFVKTGAKITGGILKGAASNLLPKTSSTLRELLSLSGAAKETFLEGARKMSGLAGGVEDSEFGSDDFDPDMDMKTDDEGNIDSMSMYNQMNNNSIEGTKASLKLQKSIYKSSEQRAAARHAELAEYTKSIEANIRAMATYLLKDHSKLSRANIELQKASAAELVKIGKYLSIIEAGSRRYESGKRDDRSTADKIFGKDRKNFNSKELLEVIKSKMGGGSIKDNLDQAAGLGSLVQSMGPGGMQDMIGSFITEAIGGALGNVMKKSGSAAFGFGELDKRLQMAPHMLWRQGLKFLHNSNEPWMQEIANMLGVNQKTKLDKKPGYTDAELKGRAEFDNKAYNAVTDVIPRILSKIYSSISNQKEMVFDYKLNDFKLLDNIGADYDASRRRIMEFGGNELSSLMALGGDLLNKKDAKGKKIGTTITDSHGRSRTITQEDIARFNNIYQTIRSNIGDRFTNSDWWKLINLQNEDPDNLATLSQFSGGKYGDLFDKLFANGDFTSVDRSLFFRIVVYRDKNAPQALLNRQVQLRNDLESFVDGEKNRQLNELTTEYAKLGSASSSAVRLKTMEQQARSVGSYEIKEPSAKEFDRYFEIYKKTATEVIRRSKAKDFTADTERLLNEILRKWYIAIDRRVSLGGAGRQEFDLEISELNNRNVTTINGIMAAEGDYRQMEMENLRSSSDIEYDSRKSASKYGDLLTQYTDVQKELTFDKNQREADYLRSQIDMYRDSGEYIAGSKAARKRMSEDIESGRIKGIGALSGRLNQANAWLGEQAVGFSDRILGKANRGLERFFRGFGASKGYTGQSLRERDRRVRSDESSHIRAMFGASPSSIETIEKYQIGPDGKFLIDSSVGAPFDEIDVGRVASAHSSPSPSDQAMKSFAAANGKRGKRILNWMKRLTPVERSLLTFTDINNFASGDEVPISDMKQMIKRRLSDQKIDRNGDYNKGLKGFIGQRAGEDTDDAVHRWLCTDFLRKKLQEAKRIKDRSARVEYLQNIISSTKDGRKTRKEKAEMEKLMSESLSEQAMGNKTDYAKPGDYVRALITGAGSVAGKGIMGGSSKLLGKGIKGLGLGADALLSLIPGIGPLLGFLPKHALGLLGGGVGMAGSALGNIQSALFGGIGRLAGGITNFGADIGKKFVGNLKDRFGSEKIDAFGNKAKGLFTSFKDRVFGPKETDEEKQSRGVKEIIVQALNSGKLSVDNSINMVKDAVSKREITIEEGKELITHVTTKSGELITAAKLGAANIGAKADNLLVRAGRWVKRKVGDTDGDGDVEGSIQDLEKKSKEEFEKKALASTIEVNELTKKEYKKNDIVRKEEKKFRKDLTEDVDTISKKEFGGGGNNIVAAGKGVAAGAAKVFAGASFVKNISNAFNRNKLDNDGPGSLGQSGGFMDKLGSFFGVDRYDQYSMSGEAIDTPEEQLAQQTSGGRFLVNAGRTFNAVKNWGKKSIDKVVSKGAAAAKHLKNLEKLASLSDDAAKYGAQISKARQVERAGRAAAQGKRMVQAAKVAEKGGMIAKITTFLPKIGTLFTQLLSKVGKAMPKTVSKILDKIKGGLGSFIDKIGKAASKAITSEAAKKTAGGKISKFLAKAGAKFSTFISGIGTLPTLALEVPFFLWNLNSNKDGVKKIVQAPPGVDIFNLQALCSLVYAFMQIIFLDMWIPLNTIVEMIKKDPMFKDIMDNLGREQMQSLEEVKVIKKYLPGIQPNMWINYKASKGSGGWPFGTLKREAASLGFDVSNEKQMNSYKKLKEDVFDPYFVESKRLRKHYLLNKKDAKKEDEGEDITPESMDETSNETEMAKEFRWESYCSSILAWLDASLKKFMQNKNIQDSFDNTNKPQTPDAEFAKSAQEISQIKPAPVVTTAVAATAIADTKKTVPIENKELDKKVQETMDMKAGTSNVAPGSNQEIQQTEKALKAINDKPINPGSAAAAIESGVVMKDLLLKDKIDATSIDQNQKKIEDSVNDIQETISNEGALLKNPITNRYESASIELSTLYDETIRHNNETEYMMKQMLAIMGEMMQLNANTNKMLATNISMGAAASNNDSFQGGMVGKLSQKANNLMEIAKNAFSGNNKSATMTENSSANNDFANNPSPDNSIINLRDKVGSVVSGLNLGVKNIPTFVNNIIGGKPNQSQQDMTYAKQKQLQTSTGNMSVPVTI